LRQRLAVRLYRSASIRPSPTRLAISAAVVVAVVDQVEKTAVLVVVAQVVVWVAASHRPATEAQAEASGTLARTDPPERAAAAVVVVVASSPAQVDPAQPTLAMSTATAAALAVAPAAQTSGQHAAAVAVAGVLLAALAASTQGPPLSMLVTAGPLELLVKTGRPTRQAPRQQARQAVRPLNSTARRSRGQAARRLARVPTVPSHDHLGAYRRACGHLPRVPC
jgi:hypothetical protein